MSAQRLRNGTALFGGFELSLRTAKDPLDVAQFRRWGAPLPSLPMPWVYGSAEAMPMAIPFVLVELPVPVVPEGMERKEALLQALPVPARAALAGSEAWDRSGLEIWVMAHAAPSRAPCQKAQHELLGEDAFDEINLSHHAWLFDGLEQRLHAEPDASITGVVHTGVFCGAGVEPVHQDLASVPSRGLAFDALEPREVIVHDGGRFSPCNCMLRLSSQPLFHHFISVSVRPGPGAAAAVLHVVPAHTDAEARLRSTIDAAGPRCIDACAALCAIDVSVADTLCSLLRGCGEVAFVSAASARAVELRPSLASLPALLPWQPPASVESGAGPPVDCSQAAASLMEMGFPDFDLNMTVLQSVGGDLDAALAFLGPAAES